MLKLVEFLTVLKEVLKDGLRDMKRKIKLRFAYRKAELRTYDKKLSTKRRSPKLYK